MRGWVVIVSIGFVLAGCTSNSGASPSGGATQDASASLLASASAQATPTQQPTPEATPAVVGILPPDSVAEVTVDRLQVREEVGLAGRVVHVLDAGDDVLVLGNPTLLGPRLADGEEWYPIVYPVDYAPESEVIGYVAVGPPDDPYLVHVDPACGGPDLESVAELTGYGRLQCFGAQELTFEGTYGCGECGGFAPGSFEPAWLAHPIGEAHVLQSEIVINADGSFDLRGRMGFRIEPGTEVGALEPGSIVRVVGQFDHPAAADCVIAAGPEGEEVEADPRAAVAYCREQFVVRSLEVIGTDPNWAEMQR